MDPQQRILLQLTWEALEDAGIPPSAIAGTEVGVFVGGSQTEYAQSPSTAIRRSPIRISRTGNALVDPRQPHLLHLRPARPEHHLRHGMLVIARRAAPRGRKPCAPAASSTAIVGGINIIAALPTFISFSQASMLSPDRTVPRVRRQGRRLRARRGRRGAGAAPGRARAGQQGNRDPRRHPRVRRQFRRPHQRHLAALGRGAGELCSTRVYSRAGIDPARLAFLEAHGTGTPVGDPIEASRDRPQSRRQAAAKPLPIGSIKTNIGHLEPASGIGRRAEGAAGAQSWHPAAIAAFHGAEPRHRFRRI